MAAAWSCSRSGWGSRGAGASAMIFWWRRWKEQSRSKRCTTRPVASPKTCTSTWRADSSHGSRKTVPSPKAAVASRRADSTAPTRSSPSRTTRSPRPPPPADALTSDRPAQHLGRRLQLARRVAVDLLGGQDGHAGGGRHRLGLQLRAHGGDRLRGRADVRSAPPRRSARRNRRPRPGARSRGGRRRRRPGGPPRPGRGRRGRRRAPGRRGGRGPGPRRPRRRRGRRGRPR